MIDVLGEEEHEVEVIDNGNDALKKLGNEDYDVILLDIKLPGMSGTDLYKHLQKMAKPFARRVIFITGDTMSGNTATFLSKTKAPHITKPFDLEQLKREMSHMLSQCK